MTPAAIRAAYEAGNRGHRHFFERSTMRFFGDTMRSYGTRKIDGVVYLYRKPSASVNVFGKWKTAGREFFGAWRFDPVNGDLHGVYDETAKAAIYFAVTGQSRISDDDYERAAEDASRIVDAREGFES